MTICHTNEFLQSQFSDGGLILGIYIKWPLMEAVGWWMGFGVFHCHPASATIFVAIANIDARRLPLFPMYETSVSSGALLCGRPWRGCDHGWFASRSSPPPPAWSVITTIVATMVSRHLAVVQPPPHTSRRRRNPRQGVDANALKHLLA